MTPSKSKKGFNLVGEPEVTKKRRSPKNKRKSVLGDDIDESIGCFFLDSGAHSLYNQALYDIDADGKRVVVPLHRRYEFFESDSFWEYVDKYCEFVKEHQHAIDYYANVDVIHNPDLSWKVLKYIEKQHKLNPVPVIHMGTSVDVLKKHIDAGYDYIGLGGVALEGTRTSYIDWADEMFQFICDTPDKTPRVKVHGFAMTAYASLVRYPWWSVDSTSWAKAGGFGMVYFPNPMTRRKAGVYQLVPPLSDWKQLRRYTPWSLSFSYNAPAKSRKYQSGLSLSRLESRVLHEWLEIIDVPIGKVLVDPKTVSSDNVDYAVPTDDKSQWGEMIEWGVVSHHAARKIANLRFFERLVSELPDWPWPFAVKGKISRGFGVI